jgi:hypothetical protein
VLEVEQYLISFKAKMCNRILCDAQKRWWRDVTECVGTESMSQATAFQWWKHFKDAQNEGPSTAVTDDNGYLGSKLWTVFTMQIHLKLICGMLLRKKKYQNSWQNSGFCFKTMHGRILHCDDWGASRHQLNTCITPLMHVCVCDSSI